MRMAAASRMRDTSVVSAGRARAPITIPIEVADDGAIRVRAIPAAESSAQDAGTRDPFERIVAGFSFSNRATAFRIDPGDVHRTRKFDVGILG